MKRKMKKLGILLGVCLTVVLLIVCYPKAPPEKTPDWAMYYVDYWSSSLGSVTELWGEGCVLDGGAQSRWRAGFYYPDGRTPFTFVFAEEKPLEEYTKDDRVTCVRLKGGEGYICNHLSSSATLAELRKRFPDCREYDFRGMHSFWVRDCVDDCVVEYFWLGEEPAEDIPAVCIEVREDWGWWAALSEEGVAF